jgi:hypothetical protein
VARPKRWVRQYACVTSCPIAPCIILQNFPEHVRQINYRNACVYLSNAQICAISVLLLADMSAYRKWWRIVETHFSATDDSVMAKVDQPVIFPFSHWLCSSDSRPFGTLRPTRQVVKRRFNTAKSKLLLYKTHIFALFYYHSAVSYNKISWNSFKFNIVSACFDIYNVVLKGTYSVIQNKLAQGYFSRFNIIFTILQSYI